MNASALLPLAILVPLGGAVLAAFLPYRAASWCSVLVSLASLVIAGTLLTAAADGPVVYDVGGWPAPYGIALVADLLGAIMTSLSALVATAAALYSLISGGEHGRERLYHPLFLLMLTALGGAFLTSDLFTLYVFMELAILSTLPLVGMARRPVSAEASFKYAVLSALGSAILLVCIALIYAAMGTLNMADISRRTADTGGGVLMEVAAALLVFVFLLKAAVFPFHFWQPDAHSAAPAPISAVLSGVLVKVGVYGLIRLEQLIAPDAAVLSLLVPIGAVAALFGGVAALANRDLKRMLAYSTISNLGFIVLALGWGGLGGIVAALANTVGHAVVKAALFLAGGFVAERTGLHEMSRLGGVAALSPIAAATFGLGALGIAGLPPLFGFLGKLTLLDAAVTTGGAFGLAALLAASGFGLAYPLRAFLRVFWGEPSREVVEAWASSSLRSRALLAPLLLVAAVAAGSVAAGPILDLLTAAAAELLAVEPYVGRVLGSEP